MQSAVLLHLIQQSKHKNIPVVFLDTQYLFKETYDFKNILNKKLKLNIKTYQATQSKAEQEKIHDKLWETNLNLYNKINKTEPMNRALKEHKADFWISGIRKTQSENRQSKNVFEIKDGYTKIHPLLDWTDKDVYDYLVKYDLPYHPLREKGYLSIGDWHSTKSIYEIEDISEIRFNGKQRECGLHN